MLGGGTSSLTRYKKQEDGRRLLYVSWPDCEANWMGLGQSTSADLLEDFILPPAVIIEAGDQLLAGGLDQVSGQRQVLDGLIRSVIQVQRRLIP